MAAVNIRREIQKRHPASWSRLYDSAESLRGTTSSPREAGQHFFPKSLKLWFSKSWWILPFGGRHTTWDTQPTPYLSEWGRSHASLPPVQPGPMVDLVAGMCWEIRWSSWTSLSLILYFFVCLNCTVLQGAFLPHAQRGKRSWGSKSPRGEVGGSSCLLRGSHVTLSDLWSTAVLVALGPGELRSYSSLPLLGFYAHLPP